MKLALCNEVLRPMEFAAQCAFAASLGFAGLEVAPFTLDAEPHLLSAGRRRELRRAASDAGIAVSGLHWLLVAPAGLSITEEGAAARTMDVMERLVGLCADLGGVLLVHGSPAQRRLPPGDEASARRRATVALARAGRVAGAAGLTYCLEPLAPPEADYATTVAEAAAIVREVGEPGLRTMLDTCAAANGETEAPGALIRRWMPTGLLAHIHLNDGNKRGPGQGAQRFGPVLRALRDTGHDGWVGVEPFDYHPDGPSCAARAVGYIQGAMEGLA